MPRNVEELIPPSTNDHSDVEAKDKWKWNKVCEPLAIDCYVLKHAAKMNTTETVLSPSNIQVHNK